MFEPSSRRLTSAVAAGVAVLVAGGCSLAPEPVEVRPMEALPEAFDAAEAPGEYAPERWWRSFGDPALDALVDTALAANFDLAEAAGRIVEARALARLAGAPRFPSVDLTGSASQSSQPANSGFGDQLAQLLGALAGGAPDSTDTGDDPSDEGPRRITTETFAASVGLSYELDLWGRIGSDAAAATRDLLATQAELETVRLGVLAETITNYLEIEDVARRLALTTETVSVLTEREELTEDRYDRGLATSFELYQVRQDLRTAQASLPQLRTQLAEARSRMAVVLGRYAPEVGGLLPESVELQRVVAPVPAGLPADLLAQRPDVRAAVERFEAARLRVGARRAELFPRLTLSGSVGLQSAEASGLLDLDQWTRNLTAGLTAPLFQGGRLRANLSAAEGRFAQATAVLGRTMLTAVEEVEAALVRYAEERLRHAFLVSQLEEAEASLTLQASRYASGVAGYLDYLDAARAELGVQSTLSAAGRDLSLALLGVHRALGGGWIQEEADDES